VISPSREEGFRIASIDGVGIYQYPAPPEQGGPVGYVLEYGWAMVATLALTLIALVKQGFDVIHAHNPPDTFFFIAALFRPFGKKFVFDHHDLSPEMYRAKFGQDSSRLVYHILLQFERLTFRLADWVISTNDSYKEVARKRGGVGENRITVVRNAPDLNRVRRVPPDPDLRSQAAAIIGYVGQMGQQDGVDYLLRALSHLVFDLGKANVLAVIVGTGDAVPSLQALTLELGLTDHVWFTGRISDEEVMAYLSTADICVDPDPWNPFNDRSTMIKMSEYMALGKPIVAFDLTEHRVTAGDSAVYAEPNDELDFAQKLSDLIEDPDRRARMGEVGLARLEHLGWRHQEQRLLAAYHKITDQAGTPPGHAA
jgi:glycosyltransferase involved in cell wall biosynthesis